MKIKNRPISKRVDAIYCCNRFKITNSLQKLKEINAAQIAVQSKDVANVVLLLNEKIYKNMEFNLKQMFKQFNNNLNDVSTRIESL